MLIHAKQQNQPERECLYAWYPEASIPNENNIRSNSREIYIQNGLDKDLIDDKLSSSTTTPNARKFTKEKTKTNRNAINFSLILFVSCFLCCSYKCA